MLKKLFILNVFLLALAQFSNISPLFGITQPKLYLFDFFIPLYALFGLLSFMLANKKIYLPKNLWIFVIFTIIAFTSLVPVFSQNTLDAFISAFLYLFRWIAYLLAAIVTYIAIKNKEFSTTFVYKVFIYSGVFLSLVGFVQLLVLPDFTVLDPLLGWDPHKNRIASTFFDPNFLGGFLVLLIILLLFKKDLFKDSARNQLLFLFFTTVFLTYSRSAWGMLSIVILFYGFKRSVWILVAAFLLVFSAYFAVPRIQTRIAGITDPSDSASLRLVSWQNTANIIQDNVFLGVGFNALKQAKIEYGFLNPDTETTHSASGTDSSFLLVLVTTGVVGFLIFISGFFLPAVSKPSFLSFALVGSLFLESQFVNSLFFPQIMFLWLSIYSLESS